jgi:hypothetical protein
MIATHPHQSTAAVALQEELQQPAASFTEAAAGVNNQPTEPSQLLTVRTSVCQNLKVRLWTAPLVAGTYPVTGGLCPLACEGTAVKELPTEASTGALNLLTWLPKVAADPLALERLRVFQVS